MNTRDVKKVVLAYSGGLDTSVMAKWIGETYGAEVVGFTADVGQGQELEGLKDKALATGCSDLFIEDLQEEFARDYIFKALKAQAIYEGTYLLGTSVARPLIAKKQMEVVDKVGADAVAHGATGKGNDQVRFELGYYGLKSDIKIIAPWREWEFKGRLDLLAYAEKHGITVTASKAQPYSTDANLMHVSYEGGVLEDPWVSPPDNIFIMTNSPEDAPSQAVTLTIGFESGIPVSVDGEQMTASSLVRHLNQIAGEHGVGRIDIVENRFVGMKSRGVYETPGVTVLHQAYRALESITLDREVMKIRDSLGTKIAELIYNGFWFSPEFNIISNMVDDIAKPVNGFVKVKLYKGNCVIMGRKSPNTLYSESLATFEKDEIYDQKDAEGFIKLNALRLKYRSPVV
tara:strand:- start:337 stop:1539 length:1203 start_codon:yes stop_codon:yes gene_type:complete